jgi:hypothetical protein
VGLTEADAARRGMAVAAYVVRALERAKYVREAREMVVKALVSGGRLIGMQIVGFSSAVEAPRGPGGPIHRGARGKAVLRRVQLHAVYGACLASICHRGEAVVAQLL